MRNWEGIMLDVGQQIPLNVKVFNECGDETTLEKFLDKPLVLYFYPKNFTTLCIQEAKQFRDYKHLFRDMGVEVAGVSSDSPKSNCQFKQQFDLNFPLLSDPKHRLQKSFGVWQEQRMFNQTQMSTIRSTFAANKKGQIIKVWSRVTVEDHVREVLHFISASFKQKNPSLFVNG